MGELLARLRCALRHADRLPNETDDSVFCVGDLQVDLLHRQVRMNEPKFT